jgi:hypothetical protein
MVVNRYIKAVAAMSWSSLLRRSRAWTGMPSFARASGAERTKPVTTHGSTHIASSR